MLDCPVIKEMNNEIRNISKVVDVLVVIVSFTKLTIVIGLTRLYFHVVGARAITTVSNNKYPANYNFF